jgi:hypothetical protein
MAMNIRGGNGYIEEWVNARLLRDAHLGSIWEGAENLVALDVARAARRERAHETLFADMETRLAGMRDADVRREAEPVGAMIARTRARLEELLAGDTMEREARMARMCDRLAALLCCTLLLQEAEAQRAGDGSYRKLLVAAEYRRRYLDGGDPLEIGTAGVRWLDEVVDWGAVSAEALAE